MYSKEEKERIFIEGLVASLELPDSAYEKAESRYKDLGEWLNREDSICGKYSPHIFPQGSFRLGTAIRPLNEAEEYDLDLACVLRQGITKGTHTQQELKELVGKEIENYRVVRGIKAPIEEKHRCWRLNYADSISFYMDIIPCIPIDSSIRTTMSKSIENSGISKDLASRLAYLTVSITDNRHPRYRFICDDWNISNPEGYAQWFENRMTHGRKVLLEKAAQVDDIPVFKRKTPLQRVVQLLKRHRDYMFREYQDLKPASIIITTLAARAYNGEDNIVQALKNILGIMGSYINAYSPKVPNPVNPCEDFADKWSTQKNLEQNFWAWLKQAQTDFELIASSDNVDFFAEQAALKFSVRVDSEMLKKKLGLVNTPNMIIPKPHIITEPAKPWRAL